MSGLRVAVDVGGTFTDAVLVDEDAGTIRRAKVLTTPADRSEGTLNAVDQFGISGADIYQFSHGSTAGINALIERKGAKTALICSQGTRDLLDMGRLRRPLGDDLYDPTWQRAHQANPIVHRRHVREVSARSLYDGSTYVDLDEDEVRAQLAFLREEGIESVAVCLLHSWKNLAHERRIVELIEEELPDVYVQWSAVRPVYGEYGRTLTCVLDAYTGPLIAEYLESLRSKLAAQGFPGQVLIMQMNGGTRTLEETVEHFPAYMIESGPVAGALGAEHYAHSRLDNDNLICMDIGGTSTDIAFIVEGAAQVTDEWEFEFSLPLGVPAVDVRSLGAGGGSIIGIDEMGTLSVGPRSAGARPGPACYGQGGAEPTITDAYVELGIVQPGLFLGGELTIDTDAAHTALSRVAEPMQLEAASLATGAIKLMNVHIENEISKMAFERALDMRNFSLLAYGGAGAIHAAQVARRLGMREAVIPYFPGGFSALGMITAPIKVERAVSIIEPVDAIGADGINEHVEKLHQEVGDDLARQGIAEEDMRFDRVLYGMYEGQSFDNRLPLAAEGGLTEARLDQWKEDFHAYYDRIYGYSAREMPIILTTASVVGIGPTPVVPLQELEAGGEEPGGDTIELRATISVDGKVFEDAPFYSRDRLLAGNRVVGPGVIDDGLSTILLPEASTATIDKFGGIHIVND
jgi:N-methylhydantoinase A